MLIYLDQFTWGQLLGRPDLVIHLDELVKDDTLQIPLSPIHVIETLKAPPLLRGGLMDLMKRLSRGRILILDAAVPRLEWERHSTGASLAWIRARLVRPAPDRVVFCSLPLRSLGLDQQYALAPDEQDTAMANADVGDLAERIRSTFSDGVDDIVEESFAMTARAFIATAAGIDQNELPADLTEAFPSQVLRSAAYRRLRRSTKRHPNDLPDLVFACMTLPYFDVVTLDSRMMSTVHEAVREVAPHAHHELIHAKTIHKLDRLLEAVDRAR